MVLCVLVASAYMGTCDILTRRHVIASAFTCGDDFSCVTNEDHNVACGSGTYSPFFTVCLDHSAYLDGGCDDAGALTGCW